MGCEQCAELQAGLPEVPFSLSSQVFGCADVDAMLPSLHFLYETARQRSGGLPPGLLVDGGANVGRATSRWIASLGDVFGRRAAANATQAPCIICAGADATSGGGAADSPPTVFVAAVEPSRHNFALLQKHAAEGSWEVEGFLAIQAALGAEAQEAMLAFNDDFAIDELATLMFEPGDSRPRQRVMVLTLDDIVRAAAARMPWLSGVGVWPEVFLLKLDIEGMEPAVLRSIPRSRARVKFVTFEYAGNVWREGLKDVLADLFQAGYFCFLIMPERLVPVSGPFWDPLYQLPIWSNFICGAEGDADLEALVQLHAGVVGLWPTLRRTFIEGIPESAVEGAQLGEPVSFAEARRRCIDHSSQCAGVTCECPEPWGACGFSLGATKPGPCTPRKGGTGARWSPSGEVTFMRDPEASELYLLYRRRAVGAA